MKYEELKAKIYSKFCGTGRQKEIDELFDQYEKENEEITEENIKNIGEKFQSWNAKAFHKALTDYHNQIESMQKEIENIKGINGLNFESHAKRLNKIEEKLEPEPKQERFYYQVYVERKDVVPHGYKYEIIDRKNVFIFERIYTEDQADEVCLFLNSLAKGE